MYYFMLFIVQGTNTPINHNSSVDENTNKNVFNRSNSFGYYIAGLIEGDGSIILRNGAKEKIAPKIVFTFHENEIPLYENLKIIFNSGIIYKEKTGVCRYTISNAETVIDIVKLVKGKFRTPKIYALHRAIDNLNKYREANL